MKLSNSSCQHFEARRDLWTSGIEGERDALLPSLETMQTTRTKQGNHSITDQTCSDMNSTCSNVEVCGVFIFHIIIITEQIESFWWVEGYDDKSTRVGIMNTVCWSFLLRSLGLKQEDGQSHSKRAYSESHTGLILLSMCKPGVTLTDSLSNCCPKFVDSFKQRAYYIFICIICFTFESLSIQII